MSKKRIVPIITLIGLTSFVVLGSSPNMLKNILELAQNNPITRTFSSSAQTESEKSKVEFAKRIQKPEVLPQKISAKTEEIPTREIPNYTLYDQLFRMLFSFKKKAESQGANSEKTIALTNYFKIRANLTDEENQILQNTALEFVQQAEPIDAQARLVIEDTRRKTVAGILSREQTPPAELVNLQEQRNQLVLDYRDRLKTSFGENGFAKFDEFIMGDFASRFRVFSLSSVNFDQKQQKEAK